MLPSNPWSILFSVFVAIFLSHLLRLQGAAKLTGYVCGIVVLGYGDDPWTFGFYRLTETLLGVGMAVLVSLVPKLMPADDSGQQDS